MKNVTRFTHFSTDSWIEEYYDSELNKIKRVEAGR